MPIFHSASAELECNLRRLDDSLGATHNNSPLWSWQQPHPATYTTKGEYIIRYWGGQITGLAVALPKSQIAVTVSGKHSGRVVLSAQPAVPRKLARLGWQGEKGGFLDKCLKAAKNFKRSSAGRYAHNISFCVQPATARKRELTQIRDADAVTAYLLIDSRIFGFEHVTWALADTISALRANQEATTAA